MAVNMNQKRRVQIGQQGSGFNFAANRQKLEAQKAQVADRQNAPKPGELFGAKMAGSGFPTQEPDSVKKSLAEKILSFTGGNILGQGLSTVGINLKTGDVGANSTADVAGSSNAADLQGQALLIKKLHETTDPAIKAHILQTLKVVYGNNQSLTPGDINPAFNLTDKQVIGDAIQLGATAATGFKPASAGYQTGQLAVKGAASAKAASLLGKVGVGANVIEKSTAPAVSGVVKGAIAGAKAAAPASSAFGAATGLSQGLKNNESIGSSVKDAAIGGVLGAGAGALIGGVVGGVSGGITKYANSGSNKAGFVEDLVSPKPTDKVKVQALQDGRVTEQGLLKSSKILPSPRDKQLAEAVKDVVSPKLSAPQNLNAIDSKVKEINSGVKSYVTENKVPFNTNQLRTQLNKGKDELNLVFASDQQAEKTYDAVVKEFLKHVDSKDTAGLFQARQEFDRIPAIKKLLDSQGLGENTKKEVALTVRNMANRYIARLLPEGNAFREQLLQESKMIEAMGNIAQKNSNTIGLNKLQILDEQYPILRWIIGSAVGAGGVGVGSTIIKSSN